MRKTSTLSLLDVLLKQRSSNSQNLLKPRKETISTILSYAKSVRGFRTKSGNDFLVSLN